MLTEKHPNMRDSQMPLAQRIDAALARITRGDCSMRIPVEATDPDIVLSDCKDLLAAKDRDLSDANHALLLANNSADAFRRVAETRAKQIEALEQQLAQVDIAVELLVTARKVNQSTVDTAMVIASGLTLPAGSGG